MKTTCVPKTGACVLTPQPGIFCDDKNKCTQAQCDATGKCNAIPSAPKTCGYTDKSDCVAQDDGGLCNGLPYCELATGPCKTNPAATVRWPAVNDTACVKKVCQPTSGKSAATTMPNGAPCTDADPCIAGEACKQGACTGGVSVRA